MLLHLEFIQQRLRVLLLLLLLPSFEVHQVILYFVFCFLAHLFLKFMRIWAINLQDLTYCVVLLKKLKDSVCNFIEKVF